jgi:molecular chaperone GrpE
MTHHKRSRHEAPPGAQDQQPADSAQPAAAPAPPQQAEGSAPAAQAPVQLALERDDLLARLQRLSADYANYQKRIAREISSIREYANENLLRDLVAVLDDIDRAYQAGAASHPPEDPLLAGLALVRAKALEVLSRYGLTAIPAEGQEFDPQRHEALLRQVGQVSRPMVAKVIHPGYELKGRMLRPAKVVVAVPPEERPDAQQSDQSA